MATGTLTTEPEALQVSSDSTPRLTVPDSVLGRSTTTVWVQADTRVIDWKQNWRSSWAFRRQRHS